MSATPNFEALLSAVTTKPRRWWLRRHQPSIFDFCKLTPDDRGGCWLELTPKNLRALGKAIGSDLHDFKFKGDQDKAFAWMQRDGMNVFDAPNTDATALVGKALSLSVISMPFGLNRPYQLLQNAHLLVQWVARQNDLIDSEAWGACFMAAWVCQNGSLHLSLGLSESGTAEMFLAMGERGGFYWNRAIKSRADLPETVRLYRGIGTSDAPEGFIGFSWTDDPAIAAHYALRRQRQGHGRARVASATFTRNEIAAVFEHDCGGDDDYREWLIFPTARQDAIAVTTIEPAALAFYPELIAM